MLSTPPPTYQPRTQAGLLIDPAPAIWIKVVDMLLTQPEEAAQIFRKIDGQKIIRLVEKNTCKHKMKVVMAPAIASHIS